MKNILGGGPLAAAPVSYTHLSQFMGRIVVIGIHERPYEDSSRFGIVVYLSLIHI